MSSSPAAAPRQASKYSSAESSPGARSRSTASATVSSSSSAHHSACGEGTRKAPSAGSGAGSSIRSRGQLGRGSSGAQHVLELDHVRGRLDPVEVELGDPVDVLEDPRELAGHPLDLLVGEPQAGEPRDVQDLVAVDHRRGF